ncbi:MAG: hypothetical protein ACREN7_02590 [Candidatus Dormibacteria bacterium]
MAEPVDLSPVHQDLDHLKRSLCHCQMKGECLGCKGIEMVRQQLQAVVAAASQPVLLQVAQEAAAKDMLTQFSEMQERLMGDPTMQEAAETVRQRLMDDPEARRMIEDLMRRLGQGEEPPPPPTE